MRYYNKKHAQRLAPGLTNFARTAGKARNTNEILQLKARTKVGTGFN